jgi:hypothetical protein
MPVIAAKGSDLKRNILPNMLFPIAMISLNLKSAPLSFLLKKITAVLQDLGS